VRNTPTIPAPVDPESCLALDIAELKLALVRVGECIDKVNLTILKVAIAESTLEHRLNVVVDRHEDFERRILRLEGLGPESTAAE
jgi:hypothetical protein